MSGIIHVRRGDAAVVTLDQPQSRNALSKDLIEELFGVLREIEADPTIRGVIIAATGTAFSAGGSIKEMTFDTLRVRSGMRRAHEMLRLIVNSQKLYMAVVDGAAFGAGFSLACCCDIVVAGDNARFCAAFTKIGLFPDVGLLWSLTGRTGASQARRLLLQGNVVEADEALDIGIADFRAPSDSAIERAIQILEGYTGAPITTALVKAALSRGVSDLEDVLRTEVDVQPYLLYTEDHIEGRNAFIEKRSPKFSGR